MALPVIPNPREMQSYGFHLPPNIRWLTSAVRAGASDAAPLNTFPNTAIPAELTQYLDPMVIEILTAPRAARNLFGEVKKGDWSVSHTKFRVDELVGRTVPYSDTANGGASDVNSNWLTREQYRYETTINYGELETAVAAQAKLDLVAAKQKAAAKVLDIDANRLYLYGVTGKDIYGFLNDPNIPAPVVVTAGATSGKIGWANKTTGEIFSDVVSCFSALVARTGGLVDNSQELRMAISPRMSVNLAKATDFNVSVQDMLGKYFANLKFVILPEMTSSAGAETAIMYAVSVNGSPSAELGFSEKLRVHALIPKPSSFEQKFSSTTYGCLVYYPMVFSGITGMENAA
jgi:hypothetical protein